MIPEGWQYVKIGEVAIECRERFNPNSAEPRPYVALENIEPRNPSIVEFGDSSAASSQKTIFEPNDILFGKLRPYLHKVAIADFSGVCSTDILAIRATNQILPRYLLNILSTCEVIQYATETSAGTKMPRTSWAALSNFEVHLPPLPEQKKIADILSSVDDAIEATRAVIEQTKQVKKGLLQELLTKGIGHTKFKQTPIGEIPEGWRYTNVGEAIDAAAITNGLYKPAQCYGQGSLIVRIDAYDHGDDVIPNDLQRVIVEVGEVDKYALEPGDILLNRVNSLTHIGKVAFFGGYDEPVIFESNMMRIRVGDSASVQSRYLFYWLCSDKTVRFLRSNAKKAVAQTSVNQSDICSIPFTVPPLNEQRQICAGLDELEQMLSEQAKTLQHHESTKAGLLQDLLTGKVRVSV